MSGFAALNSRHGPNARSVTAYARRAHDAFAPRIDPHRPAHEAVRRISVDRRADHDPRADIDPVPTPGMVPAPIVMMVPAPVRVRRARCSDGEPHRRDGGKPDVANDLEHLQFLHVPSPDSATWQFILCSQALSCSTLNEYSA